MIAPAVFVAHASPMLALEREGHARALREFGARFPDPDGIVVISAHWEGPAPVRVTSSARPPLIYDFGGFPRALYELAYPAPGSPSLAREVVAALGGAGIAAVEELRRGWDHGVWVPLLHLYPKAAAPVVEVSLPIPREPADVVAIGRALAPLRERGVLLLGSGGIVHNLGRARLDRKDAPVDEWARRFDAWVRERVARREVAELAEYRATAPHADLAAPETEHFDPIFLPLGAARPDDVLEEVDSGFEHANLSLASYAFLPGDLAVPRPPGSPRAFEPRRTRS